MVRSNVRSRDGVAASVVEASLDIRKIVVAQPTVAHIAAGQEDTQLVEV